MKIDIESIKKNLMVKYPLFGSILANTEFVEDDEVGTAGTDGNTIWYSPTFLNTLTEKERTFILAHEVCHIAFDHAYRSKGKNKEIWNIATDAVINALLEKDGLPLVQDGINMPEAINYNAEEMYERLLGDAKNVKASGSKPSNNTSNINDNGSSNESANSQNSSDTAPNDNENKENENMHSNSDDQKNNDPKEEKSGRGSHVMWDKAIEKRDSPNDSQESKAKEGKNNLFDKLFNQKKIKEEKQKEEKEREEAEVKRKKEEHIRKLTEKGETKSFDTNKVARKKQLEELMNSIADQSHNAGRESNGEFRKVDGIGVAKALIDWRRLLKESLHLDVDWSYANATVEDGVVTAHLEELPKPETEIVLDTSGSIDEVLLKNFLRECKNIVQTSKVKVGCFDVKFYGFTEIKNMNDIDNITFIGGGGTDFNAAVNAFTKRVDNKIIFTDGCASMPSKAIDAIWVVFANKEIEPKGGKVIYINEEQLKKLYSYKNENKKTR